MKDKDLRDLVIAEAKRVIALAEGLFKPHEIPHPWREGEKWTRKHDLEDRDVSELKAKMRELRRDTIRLERLL